MCLNSFWTSLVFVFCYERDFMMYLSDNKQADIIGAFTLHPDVWTIDININNVYFDNKVSQISCQIYPSGLQLNKANTSDTKATF